MDYCPHCGEEISPDAECCPHCGSDAETGWNPESEYYSVDLPEEEDYTPRNAQRSSGIIPVVVAAVLALVALARLPKGEGIAVAIVLCICLVVFLRTVNKSAT